MSDLPTPDEIDRTTSTMACPHCGGHIQLGVRVKVVAVYDHPDAVPAKPGEIPAALIPPLGADKRIIRTVAWMAALAPSQRAILDEAREQGLIDALRVAVEHIPAGQRPRVIERFLLTTVALADTPITVPRWMLNALRDQFPEGNITVYKTYALLVIVIAGELRGFLPTSSLEGKPVNRNDRYAAAHTGDDPGWFKTRFGYVSRRTGHFDVLRKRYLGEFHDVL